MCWSNFRCLLISEMDLLAVARPTPHRQSAHTLYMYLFHIFHIFIFIYFIYFIFIIFISNIYYKYFFSFCWWILSLCTGVKGCVFSMDEHFQVQRLIFKSTKLNMYNAAVKEHSNFEGFWKVKMTIALLKICSKENCCHISEFLRGPLTFIWLNLRQHCCESFNKFQ